MKETNERGERKRRTKDTSNDENAERRGKGKRRSSMGSHREDARQSQRPSSSPQRRARSVALTASHSSPSLLRKQIRRRTRTHTQRRDIQEHKTNSSASCTSHANPFALRQRRCRRGGQGRMAAVGWDALAQAASPLCSVATALARHPHGSSQGGCAPRPAALGPRRLLLGGNLSSGAPSCTGWEVRAHGNGSRSTRITSMAVAPSQPAAGVTESGNFSQSDEDLASRGLSCHSTIDDLDLDQLNSLFSKVSFPQREKAKLLRALQNTQALTWVQETESKRLIGFARATGDKVFHAIIWDVVVDPAYQGLGLGKVLMERLMADLVKMGISNIALYAEPTVVGFYQPLGFIADPDGIRAMAYSRRR